VHGFVVTLSRTPRLSDTPPNWLDNTFFEQPFLEEEAVEMNSTAKRWKIGLIMVGNLYFIGNCLSKRKLMTCAAL
jgi:hypothetical protein